MSTACGQRTTNAPPSQGHYVLANLVSQGNVHMWLQLTPDGQAQKAGCAQEKVMELTGSWYDPCNPVIRKNGAMRQEFKVRYFQDLKPL